MDVTSVTLSITEESEHGVLAYGAVCFDESFVVRDLKVISSPKGTFVAMPARKVMSHCHRCDRKNHLTANFCNHCGCQLPVLEIDRDDTGRFVLYKDVAHPVTQDCRDVVCNAVMEQLRRDKEPKV